MGKSLVYCVPVAFGFGPTALAIAVARQLRMRHPDIVVNAIGDGIALDLMRGSAVFETVEAAPVSEMPGAVGGDSMATGVFFADFDRVGAARASGLRTVVVDPLYWMWDEDPVDPATVDLYLALAFPGVAERRAARGQASAAVRVVPQIVDLGVTMSAWPGPRETLMLNLGGAFAPLGNNHGYLRALIETVVTALDGAGELLVTCSSVAAGAIGQAGPVAGATLTEQPFDEMMAALGRCSRLLTLPGQSIMWEALRLAVPMVVLPGGNYSQHRQVGAYQRFFADVPFITWDDLDGYATLPAGLPEAVGVRSAVEMGERLVSDEQSRGRLAALVADALASPALPPSLRGGHPWSDFDGAIRVADEIAQLSRLGG